VKHLYKLKLLILFLLAGPLCSTQVKASHAAGGEISYEWISDSTYRVYFKFYRDCTGTSEPTTVPMCISGCSIARTKTLTKIIKLPDSTANGTPVSAGCPPNGTKCTNSSSTVPGYREWWYTDTVKLTKCSLWKFSLTISTRNSSVNIGSQDFYIEATLNNFVAQGNSSPFFSVKPVPSVCINQPYTYNNGAVDPNSDSLRFQQIQPLYPAAGGCPYTPASIAFSTSASPAYNISTNPLQTNNSFVFDSTTGQMSFTPTLVGANTITVKVNEYRNGVFIGSVMRDVQVQVINCSVTAPIVSTVSGSISGATYVNNRIEACANVPFSFCFDLKSSNTSAIIVASDNHNAAASGSSVNYVGQKSDSVRGCFSWTPSTLDTGLRVFSVTAKDSTCVSPGVTVSQTFVLPIYIWPITDIIKDTTICYGDSVSLLAVGGSNFTWTVISGGSPISSLSCTSCKQPYAKPTVLTQYIVTNSGVQYCNKNKDTVTVGVLDIRNDTLSATGVTPICQGDTLKLFSTTAISGYGYKWSGPASYSSTLQNPFILSATTAMTGNYILKSSKSGCYSIPDTVAIVVSVTPAAPAASNNGPLCPGTTLNLNAATVSGATYSWTGPNSFSSSSQNPSLSNIQSVNAGAYTVKSVIGSCISTGSTTTLIVKVKPSISSSSFVNPTTCSGVNGSITLNGLANSTGYSVDYKKNGLTQTTVNISTNTSGSLTLTGLGAGVYSGLMVTLNGCGSDTLTPITLSDPAPPSVPAISFTNPTTCSGTNGTITVGGLVSGTGYAINYRKNGVVQTTVNALSNGSGNILMTGLSAANYSRITVTLNNCISDTTAPVILSDPLAPIVSANNNTPICEGDTIKLSAISDSIGVTWSWTGPGSYTSTSQNPIRINSLPGWSGTYSVVAAKNNCSSIAATTAAQVYPTPAAPVVGNNGPLCSGATLNLTASTIIGGTYKWTGPNSFSSTNQNPVISNVDTQQQGAYTVRDTVNGCVSAPATTTVMVYRVPVIGSYSATNPTTCNGTDGTIALSGLMNSANYTVNYLKDGVAQTPAVLFSNGSGSVTVTGLGRGVYSRMTVALANCVSDTIAPVTLLDPLPPSTPTTSFTHPTTCSGINGTITLGGLISGTNYIVNYLKNGIAQTPVNTISNGAGTITIASLGAGTYSGITVTLHNCLSDTAAAITLIDPAAPAIISAGNNTPICEGDTIKLIATSDSSAVNWLWTGPGSYTSASQNALRINSLLSWGGIYSVTATKNNCTSVAAITTVQIKPAPATPVVNNNGPLCSGATLNLTASVISGATYSWTGPNSFSSINQNCSISNVDTQQKGIYTVIDSVNGCASLPGTTTVMIYHTPVIGSYSAANPKTCNGTEGTITLSGLINSSVYVVNYHKNGVAHTPLNLFSNGSGSVTMTGLGAGTYSKIAISLNNCSSDTIAPIILTDPSAPVVTAGNNTPICQGDTISLSATSDSLGVTWLWSGPGGYTSISQNPIRINSLPVWSGAYSVAATKNNCGSIAAMTFVLVKPTPPTPVINSNSPLCSGNTLNLTASTIAGATYSWSGPNLFSSTDQDPVISNVDTEQNGVYTVTDTVNGCSSIPGTTTVVIYHTPIIGGYTSSNPVTCNGTEGTITLTGLGNSLNYMVNYRKNGIAQTPVALFSNGSGSIIMTGLRAGVYSGISVTLNNCASDTIVPIILEDPLAPIVTGNNNTPICQGDTIKLTAASDSAGVVWSWIGPGGYSSASQNPVRLNSLPAWSGTYSITAAKNNCISLAVSMIILVKPTPAAPIVGNNGPLCSGSTLNLTASVINGATYNWTGPNSFNSANQNPVLTNIDTPQKGNYTVIDTVNGCISSPATTTVIIYHTPVIGSYNYTNPTTCSGNDGTITLNGLVNSTNYIINYYKNGVPVTPVTLLSDGAGSVILTSLNAGIYSKITVTLNNCTSDTITPIALADPIPPVISFSTTDPTTCLGNEGTISIGGLTQGLTYTVNYSKNSIPQPALLLTATTSNNVVITGLTAAAYSAITVTIYNCVSNTSGTITLNDPVPPSITLLASANPTTCLGSNGSITLGGLTAGVVYTVNYNKNSVAQSPITLTASTSGTVMIIGLTAATYSSITATVNNCTSNTIGSLVLSDPLPPSVTCSNNTPICEADTIKLFAFSISGVTYSWVGPSGFTSVAQNPILTNAIPVQSGVYSVTATINNCTSAPATTTVLVKPTPATPTAGSNSPICSGNTLVLTAANVPTASYNWTGPAGYTTITQNPTRANALPAMSGTYTVIATINGCVSAPSSANVTVYPLPAPVVGSFTISHPTTCFGTDGRITLNGLNASTIYIVNYQKNNVAQSALTLTSNAAGSLQINGLSSGIYSSITITSPNGCTSDPLTTQTLNDPIPPVIFMSANSNPTTCLGSEGTITLGGLTQNLSYLINYSKNGLPQAPVMLNANSSGNVIISNLAAGTYSAITVTINNCVSNIVGPVSLSDPLPPVISVTNNTPICQADTIKLFVSGVAGISYSWSGPGSYSSSVQNPVIINAQPAQSGIYSVTGTLNNCTSLPVTTTVTVKPTPPTPVAGNNGPLCAGSQLNLTASAVTNANYTWTGPAFISLNFNQNPSVPNTVAANSGTYSVTATVNGCVSSAGVTNVVIYPIPSPPTVTPVIYCEQDITTALTAGGINLLWYTASTGGTGNATAPVPTTTIAGVTTWYVSQTVNGCESPRAAIAVTVNIKPQPPIVSPANYTYCQFENAQPIQVTGTSLKWYSQLTGGIGTPGAPLPSTAAAGTFYYYISQTNSFGCESDRSMATVDISASIKAIIKTDKDTVCQYDTITVNNNAINPSSATYKWNFDGGIIISGDTSGPYKIYWNKVGGKLIVLNITNGVCNDSAKYGILVKPAPTAAFELKDDACIGDSLELKPYWIDFATYTWSFDGGVIFDSTLYKTYRIKWNTAGQKLVSLKITAQNKCVSVPNIHIVDVHDNPEAKIISVSHNDICYGDTIMLTANIAPAGYEYKWIDTRQFLTNNTSEVWAQVTKTGNLFLNIKDNWGCIGADSIYINTHPCCDVYLPDAFTPNGDGKNDKFRIITIGHHAIRIFMIVNRWGQKIFETSDEKEGWDGSFKGAPQDAGTYNYYIKFVCNGDEMMEKKGEVILVR
jgi:gliding motility-associated-like protein